MNLVIFKSDAGEVALPDEASVLNDGDDGGHLIVDPPRNVWDRTALAPDELTSWSFLVASAARAMLETLPQLQGGCINYWDAGNWSLNDLAPPEGPKIPPQHRVMHLHLFGRSPRSESPFWQWGEAPFFPHFVERVAWAADHRRLSPAACAVITNRIGEILTTAYGQSPSSIQPSTRCPRCDYTVVGVNSAGSCRECGVSVDSD